MQIEQLINAYAQNSKIVRNVNFNANKAFVTHSIAMQQLYIAHTAQHTNTTQCTCTTHICKCKTAHIQRYTINIAIKNAQAKLNYAQTHTNFCVKTALHVLQAFNKASVTQS